MNKIILQSLKYILAIIIIYALISITYKGQNFGTLIEGFRELNLFWMLMILTATILVHFIRVWRWNLLIKASDSNSTFYHTLQAMMLGYFVNLGIPRLGEISRCLVLKETQNVPFKTNLGTVIIERVIDIICLILFVALTYWLNYDVFQHFFDSYIFNPLFDKIGALDFNKILLILGVIAVLFTVIIWFLWTKKSQLSFKIKKFALELWQGLKSIIVLEKKLLFIVYSILIWVGYFYMTYWWFKAYPSGIAVGMSAGLVIVSVGNLARSVPIQGGGAGAYHFLMANVVLLFGLNEADGRFLAFAIHGLQTLFYVINGIVFGALYLWQLKKIKT